MKFSTSPHTRAQAPCTFARAPPSATALGLGRGVTPPRCQCLRLGVAIPRSHICRRSFLVVGSLGLPGHGSPAAHDAAGIVFRMALPILPAPAIAVCISSPARQQLTDVRPDLRPGGGSAIEAMHSTNSCPVGISLAPVSVLGFLPRFRVLCIARRQSAAITRPPTPDLSSIS